MKHFGTTVVLSIVALFGLTWAAPNNLVSGANVDINAATRIWSRGTSPPKTDPALGLFNPRGVVERSSVPKFNTVQEYITYAHDQQSKFPEDCSQAKSPQDCQNCYAAITLGWLGALFICRSNDGPTVAQHATAIACCVAATGLYITGQIKCLTV